MRERIERELAVYQNDIEQTKKRLDGYQAQINTMQKAMQQEHRFLLQTQGAIAALKDLLEDDGRSVEELLASRNGSE